jgi:hypothetical protein
MALRCSGYGVRPSTAAYRVAPSAHTSSAGVGSSPRASWGEKYAGVPLIRPEWVSVGSPVVLEMPKSEILAPSLSVTRMLPGFTSRWTVPRLCAAASPSATWAPILAARSGVSRPSWAVSWARVRPGTYSITSQMRSPSSIASKIDTTFGWLSGADERASRIARARSGADSPGGCPTCLTATSRPSSSSRHSQTCPMPPRPTSRSTR